jgi:hypothetical protein
LRVYAGLLSRVRRSGVMNVFQGCGGKVEMLILRDVGSVSRYGGLDGHGDEKV